MYIINYIVWTNSIRTNDDDTLYVDYDCDLLRQIMSGGGTTIQKSEQNTCFSKN